MRKLIERLLRVMEDKADDLLTPHDPETKQYNREHSKAREWEGELEFGGYGMCIITIVDGLDIANFKSILKSRKYTIRRTPSGASWGVVEALDSGDLLATIDDTEIMETMYENLEIDWERNV